jgi:hypothetical protein
MPLLLFNMSDTAACDTPANLATSCDVFFFIFGSGS